MLEFLARILGPSRAVSAYVALRRFGIPAALLIGFVAIFLFMVRATDANRLEHLAYLSADVVAVTPLTSSPSSGVWVDIRLPDGTEMRMTETEGAISGELDKVACLERQRNVTTGEISYRLRRLHRCAG